MARSCHSPPRSQTSLVAHCSCPVRAAITTPVGSPAAFLARFTGDGDLPRLYGGSAPTLTLSRPARCSLTLRPARSAVPLKGSFLEVLQAICRLLTRPECFRLEREFAGLDFHQGEQCTLARHTHQQRRTRHATCGSVKKEQFVRGQRRRRRELGMPGVVDRNLQAQWRQSADLFHRPADTPRERLATETHR